MGSLYRKFQRNKLKKEIGSNKIRDIWHQRNATIEEIMREGMKMTREKNNRK